jgi:hypothetical protein
VEQHRRLLQPLQQLHCTCHLQQLLKVHSFRRRSFAYIIYLLFAEQPFKRRKSIVEMTLGGAIPNVAPFPIPVPVTPNTSTTAASSESGTKYTHAFHT